MLERLVCEKIAIEVIRVLVGSFNKLNVEKRANRNAPFHEAFLRGFEVHSGGVILESTELISLGSWLQGLNTTLGQSFFESVAHAVSGGDKRDFTGKKGTRLKISPRQKSVVHTIMDELTNGNRKPDVQTENRLLFQADDVDNASVEAVDFVVDNCVETTTQVICVELKTVQPSSGLMKQEKRKILEGKAAIKNRYPNKEVIFVFGFPFDPLNDVPTGFDKERFRKRNADVAKFITAEEFWIAEELWHNLSGVPGTMQEILNIIDAIATPDFMNNYKFIREHKNYYADTSQYRDVLNKWFLFSEIEISDKYGDVATKPDALWQDVFTNAGRYNLDRHIELMKNR
jgi:hypothetical protein